MSPYFLKRKKNVYLTIYSMHEFHVIWFFFLKKQNFCFLKQRLVSIFLCGSLICPGAIQNQIMCTYLCFVQHIKFDWKMTKRKYARCSGRLHSCPFLQLTCIDESMFIPVSVSKDWKCGKQCSPWSDAARCGVWSSSTLFLRTLCPNTHCTFDICWENSFLVITKTYLYNFDPLKPHFYVVKLGFTGVYIIFLISAQKHRLWVLVRTASARRF